MAFLTGHAWADGNSTNNLVPMFNPANIHTNTYTNTEYNFSIQPPQGWIPVSIGNSSDNSIVVFGNENPQSEANFAIYYNHGIPISDQIWNLPDQQILQLAISKLVDASKYTVYQQNIERFSDGFVIQAVVAQNQTSTTNLPVIEEFSFWLKDGRQYFLVMASSQSGLSQNAAEFERSVYSFYVSPSPTQIQIPAWIKNTAKWWSDGKVDDKNFLNGIQYLIKHGIIVIPQSSSSAQPQQGIPTWIKNSAGWWADGKTSDGDFVKGIQYLINNGIINPG